MQAVAVYMPIDVAWIAHCAERLREQWPRADRTSLDEAAAELWALPKWRALFPREAAEEWLRLASLPVPGQQMLGL